jgi:hypothetical protein
MVSQDTLQHLWRFTEDDLNANRQGRLSERQIEAQNNELALMVKVGLIGVAVVMSIATIIILIVGELIVIPVLLVLAAFFMGAILRHRQHAVADLRTGEVRVIQGPFRVERKIRYSAPSKTGAGTRQKRSYYYLHVGEQEFVIRSEVFSELTDHEGGEITVYYLARSKRIVSAEMM